MAGYYGRNEKGELVPAISLKIDQLAKLRKRRGVGFNRQAEEMGIGAADLCKYRQGQHTPEVFNLRKLCEYYDVSADWLIGIERDDWIGMDAERALAKKLGVTA